MKAVAVQPVSSTRLAWPDLGRGAAVLVVLLYHTLAWMFLVGGDDGSVGYRAWSWINEYLGLWRMPFLLLIVGIFARDAVADGRWSARLGKRVAAPFYLYGIWLIIYFGLTAAVGPEWFPHAISSWKDLATQLVLPDTTLWFIFAVGVYLLLMTAMMRLKVPGWVVIVVLAAFWVISSNYPLPLQANKIVKYAVCFAVGFYGSRVIRERASRSALPQWEVWALVGLTAVSTLVLWTGRGGLLVPLVDLVRCLSVVLLAIYLISRLPNLRLLNRFGTVVGRRTLPIYVLHVPVLAVLMSLLPAAPAHIPLVLMVCAPIAVVALTLLLCLGVQQIAERFGAGWLFALPKQNLIFRRKSRPQPIVEHRPLTVQNVIGTGARQ